MKRIIYIIIISVILVVLFGCTQNKKSVVETTAKPTPRATPEILPEFTDNKEELTYMMNLTMNSDPVFEYCPEYDPVGYPNIKAIWFTGAKFNDKDTKVFAYIGYPDSASANKKVPAIVLQHGGGGFAYPEWMKMWMDKGYAAIAVCNTGYYPASEGMTDFWSIGNWSNRLSTSQKEADARVLAPNNDGMNASLAPLNRQWMFHAVTQTIIANNILRSDDRVDNTKIGLTGISWGGVIASITIGYDNRFAFAIPVYGSGYLYESLAWIKDNFNSPGTKDLWDPSLNLNKATMPILWLGWTNDSCFSINSQDKSFANTPNSILSLQMNLLHGHIEGWNPPEIYRFADSIVKSGNPLTTCVTQPQASRNISFTINKPVDTASVNAKVYYITENMTYSLNGWQKMENTATIDQKWSTVPCSVNNTTITATLPDDAYSFYVEIVTSTGMKTFVTTSRFITIG